MVPSIADLCNLTRCIHQFHIIISTRCLRIEKFSMFLIINRYSYYSIEVITLFEKFADTAVPIGLNKLSIDIINACYVDYPAIVR